MNHKQLVQQMTEMKAALEKYQSELTHLRAQVSNYENVEAPAPAAGPTSRRKLLKRMAIAGIGGIGAIGLAATTNPNYTVLAGSAQDNAIEASGGASGYGVSAYGGLAPLFLQKGNALPTNTSNHIAGELYVDDKNDLYYLGLSNPPDANSKVWRRISGGTTAGGFTVLPNITRIVFTDLGTTLNPGTGQILGYGSTPNDDAVDAKKKTFKTTSSADNRIPPGATAIFATFTTYGYPSRGFLTAWKTGSSFPKATQTIPLVTVSNVPGVTFSNTTAVIPLSPEGEFNVACTTNTSLVVDVQGYFL